jgi:hypothetical protein
VYNKGLVKVLLLLQEKEEAMIGYHDSAYVENRHR